VTSRRQVRAVNSVAVWLEVRRGATSYDTPPVVLANAGVENVNAQVDELVTTGVLRRLLAFTELKFSNTMIEAWWRSLTHQWLFLHPLIASPRSVDWSRSTFTNTTACFHLRRFAKTPDEMYFRTGDAVPADLTSRGAAARQARIEAKPIGDPRGVPINRRGRLTAGS
jgi:putative transposase